MREYIDEFVERATELSKLKINECPKLPERNRKVEEMIEEYFSKLGKMPPKQALDRLADYLLIKELKDKDVDKVANNAFPILSEIQFKRRNRKQMLMQDETIDFLNTKLHKNLDTLARTPARTPEY